MSNKVLAAHELEVVLIMIPLEVLDFPHYKSMEEAYIESKDEKPKMLEVQRVLNLAYSYGAVGNQIYDEKYLTIFMPLSDKKKIDELFAKYEEMGKEPKYGSNTLILDKRYLEGGKFYGISVPVPPPYLDDYIRDTLERYGKLRLLEDEKDQALIYCIELAKDDDPVLVLVRKGFMCGGLKNQEMHITEQPEKDYKDIMGAIENDILAYREEKATKDVADA